MPTATTTLGSELDELLILDDIRRRARKLRIATIRGLAAEPYPIAGLDARTADPGKRDYDRDQPTDVVELALVLSAERVASKRGVAFEKPEERRTFEELLLRTFGSARQRATHGSELGLISLDALRPAWGRVNTEPSPDGSRAKEPTLDSIPTMRYARILHELVGRPGFAFDIRVSLSYYGLVRELYTAGHPDWVIGSARASEDSSATAFVTNECVRAILSLHASLDLTVSFCEALALFLETVRYIDGVRSRLEGLADDPGSGHEPLKEWVRMEEDRATTALVVTLNSVRRRILFTLPIQLTGDEQAYSPQSYQEVKLLVDALPASLIEQLEIGRHNVERALAEVENWRNGEREAADRQRNDAGRSAQRLALSATAHEIARLSLKNGKADIEAAQDLLRQSMDAAKWSALAELLRTAASRVRRTLRPVANFAGAVLDRELARASAPVSSCDPAEAIFAANTFGAITRRWNDPRMCMLATIVERHLEDDGKLPPGKPFQVRDRGYTLHAAHSEVTRAIARLIQMSDCSFSAGSAEKLLRYYERSCIPMDPDGRAVGFTANRYSKPRVVSWWASALALNALDRMVRMLNAVLRRRVLHHIAPSRVGSLQLSGLIPTDYGLSSHPGGIGRSPRAPLALQIERMRAHLMDSRLPKLANWPETIQSPVWSAVLYGPPGTGKTTLFEALAATAGPHYNLVTVTPSDIIVDGMENVELRSKQVMKALTLLSDTVILFDEFDEFIRQRSIGKDGSQNVFSFVTPGMLTKFRELHKASEENRVVYALATNMIGNLDDAAIRDGRFDLKMGVYPPDVLSRWGTLIANFEHARRVWSPTETRPAWDEDRIHRLVSAIRNSGGAPMNTLGQPGWLGRPSKSSCTSGARSQNTLFDYVSGRDSDPPSLPPREFDDSWGTEKRCGRTLLESDFKSLPLRPAVAEFIEMQAVNLAEKVASSGKLAGPSLLIEAVALLVHAEALKAAKSVTVPTVEEGRPEPVS